MNQLERDLRRQVRRKLELWLRDVLELYEMAELSPHAAIAVSLESLLQTFCGLVVASTNMSPNEVGQIVHDAMEIKRQQRTRMEAEE